MSIYVYQQLHAVAKRHETSLLLCILRKMFKREKLTMK